MVPAEPSACGKEGNDGDDPQEFGKGCFKRLGLGGEKVGFADAVGSEADVFRFVASASAFDNFKRYTLTFGGRVRQCGEGGERGEYFLTHVFFPDSSELPVVVPADDGSVMTHFIYIE